MLMDITLRSSNRSLSMEHKTKAHESTSSSCESATDGIDGALIDSSADSISSSSFFFFAATLIRRRNGGAFDRRRSNVAADVVLVLAFDFVTNIPEVHIIDKDDDGEEDEQCFWCEQIEDRAFVAETRSDEFMTFFSN
jgi:hypothetical protein